MKLNAKEIEKFDTLANDRLAVNNSQSTSLNYYTNVHYQIAKREREIWTDLIDKHNLDRNKGWTVKWISGEMMIVEMETK
jgi:hypothetical protein